MQVDNAANELLANGDSQWQALARYPCTPLHTARAVGRNRSHDRTSQMRVHDRRYRRISIQFAIKRCVEWR
jgi:hypothetical protein